LLTAAGERNRRRRQQPWRAPQVSEQSLANGMTPLILQSSATCGDVTRVATRIGATAYDPVVPPHNSVVGRSGRQPPSTERVEAAPKAATPAWRPPGVAAVEQAFQLLGRALRQFHTYPPTSPLCADAVAACCSALASLDGRDQVVARVGLHDLTVDDHSVGAGTIVEHELVRRLHRAGVGALTIDCAASPRDLSRFCRDLISLHEAPDREGTLAERLLEHGVDRIVPRIAFRPEIVGLGAPAAPLCDLVERERERRGAVAANGPAAHLYPPDKGWIRLDPASAFTTISLVDLAILISDPADFAAVLLRLTDDDAPAAGSQQTALELKFSDVTTLFASLDPRLAQLMFSKLARAVLALEPGQRQSLLQRTILPGVLDGRPDGRVLSEFPDIDLAESLCLLLDLETAAPEVLSAALDRMNLPADRRQALAPLLDAGIRERLQTGRLRDAREKMTSVDRYARKLLQFDATAAGSFAEFAAFDLAVDAPASAALAQVRADVEVSDLVIARIECLSNLVRLEPNPSAVEGFLEVIPTLLGELERASRWQDVVSWLGHHRQLTESLRQSRPDVADAIAAALEAFCTRERAMALVDLYGEDGEQRALAHSLAEAYGPALAPACVVLLDDPGFQPKARSLAHLMCEHAARLAPRLATESGRAGTVASAAIVKVLACAGSGYETAIAGVFECGDEHVVREACRALARIGTPQAAMLVARQVEHANDQVRNAAQEALCRFPPAQVQAHVRELLARRDFVRCHPDTALKLLERVVRTDAGGLRETLAALAPYRFRLWNPALARVGAKARNLLTR
jgi:hypothetical protein